MARLRNHVNYRELGEAVGLIRVGGIGSCCAGNWQENLSKAAMSLDRAGIKFAYVVDDGSLAEISVDGRKSYDEAKSILSEERISGIVPPSGSYFSK